ncbi:MG2 domain-containing protein [Flexithrix dorotheae]|uniref:alpha-2-macroglobulin family protein n=1 Tax=Flexithrix dorotheae TaxID=70993 RepID=UPI000361BBCF|nr:alpha-2-macroglobulin family protein [Flexithrix dorotheae]
MSQKSFNLNVTQSFSEYEDAFVFVSENYYNGPEKGIDKANFVLYRVENPVAFAKKYGTYGGFNLSSTDSLLQTLPITKTWNEDLVTNKNEYQKKIDIGKLSEGIYILEALSSGHVSHVPVVISNYDLVAYSYEGDLLAYVAHKKDGKIIEGFDLFIESENKWQKQKTTDGKVSHLEVLIDAYNMPLLAIKNNSVCLSSHFFYNYYNQNDKVTAYVFTDRSAYRPGQMVKFKGVFREKQGFDYKLLQDSIEYSISSPEGGELLKKKVKLDEHGTFADSIFIESTMPLGTYSINIQSGSTHYYRYNNDCEFRVEEYKKPEYEVKVNFDKDQYIAGDEMKVSVKADYFFGAPVKNAEVSYKVIREEHYIPYYARFACGWWYDDFRVNNSEVVFNGSGKISEEGAFEVTVPTDSPEGKNYKFKVIAEVKDASRRTISGSANVNVSNTAFNISARSEQYYYNPTEKVNIWVSAYDLKGFPVKTAFTASLYSHKNYSEQKHLIEKKKGVTSIEKPEVSCLFSIEESGYYTVETSATDKNGKLTTSTASFYVFDSDRDMSWWNSTEGGMEIITDKKVYNAGDTVKVAILAPNAGNAVYVIQQDKLKDYDVLNFNVGEEKNTLQEIKFVLDNNAYGKQQIAVFYSLNGQLYQKKADISVIPQMKYLNVEMTFNQQEYRPGKMAKALLKVTDENGNPMPNAQLTLSTADESIYSLYPDATKDIREVFYPNQSFNNSNIGISQMNEYSYSEYLGKGILWRKDKLNIDFERSFYLLDGAWRYIQLENYRPKKNFSLKGFVVDFNTGKPLANVKVKAGKAKGSTDENGYYELVAIDSNTTAIKFSLGQRISIVKNLYPFDMMLNVGIGKSKKEIELDKEKLAEIIRTIESAGDISPTLVNNSLNGEDRNSNLMHFSLGGAEEDMLLNEMAEVPAAARSNEAILKKGVGADKPFKEATIRKDFQDAIYWNPGLVTDENGEVVVNIKLPDNLTTWRTTAKVITQDTKVGQTMAKIVVTKDLLVRIETPRFINLGDEMLIATNIHNYLSKAKKVKVALKTDGITVKGTEKIIEVPANGEEKIDWKISTIIPTEAKLTVEALTNEESDAKQVSVPVHPFGLEVVTSSAAFLSNKDQHELNIKIPQSIDLDNATIEINAAPSVAAALLSSLNDLIGYPYGCVEQTMSRFQPTLIVANTIKTLGGDFSHTIDPTELPKMVEKGVKRLKELQHPGGGWGWWENDATHPFMTAYVVDGLHYAKETGYEVDDKMYWEGVEALKNQLSKNDIENTTYAYALMVGMKVGISDLWPTKKMPDSELNAYQYALWLQAALLAKDHNLAGKIQGYLENSVNKEGTHHYWGGKKFYYNWQDDQVETTAHVVKALSMVNPNHELIPGAVLWLMSKRKGNSWHNTRQTAMTIYSLQDILKQEINPDIDLDIYVNDKLIANLQMGKEAVFKKGKTLVLKGEKLQASLKKQMSEDEFPILKSGKNIITLKQTGKGNTYFSAKLSYFLEKDDEELLEEARQSNSFVVEREYFKLVPESDENGNLVYNKVPTSGKGIRSGDDILVKVKIRSNTAQEYVLVEDPIPAGCEFIRDEDGYNIKGEELENKSKSGYYRWSHWYTHSEFRDNRYALTITNLNKGEYEYSYMLKAQIPGKFNVAPAVVQLMYYPEKRGFSDFEEIYIGQ